MASTNKEAVEKIVVEFNDMIKKKGYLPQQYLTLMKQGYFRKRCQTELTKKTEKIFPAHKPMKDRLTLLLCGSAIRDFKLKQC